MNELLPIVRRVRRPLVVAESVSAPKPPVVVGNVEPVNATTAAAPTVEPPEGAGESKPTEATSE